MGRREALGAKVIQLQLFEERFQCYLVMFWGVSNTHSVCMHVGWR